MPHCFRMSLVVVAVAALSMMMVVAAADVTSGADACPANHVWVQSEAQIVADGCSVDAEKANEVLKRGSDDITPCCTMLSACYKVCGVDKAVCDKEYTSCIKNACKMSTQREKCEAATKPLLSAEDTADSLASDEIFAASQSQACACTTVPSVLSRYADHAKDILSRSTRTDVHFGRKLKEFRTSILRAHSGVAMWRPFLKFMKDNVKGIKKAEKQKKEADEEL